jgi:carbon-monoxide dehydrogenase medium subunit
MTVRSYERPESLEEATRLLIEHEGSQPLSGGTDLAVAMRHGTARPRVVVDLKGIPELTSSITRLDGGFRIAANTVMTALERDEDVRRELPGLVEAAEVVGSVQIRNRATRTDVSSSRPLDVASPRFW